MEQAKVIRAADEFGKRLEFRDQAYKALEKAQKASLDRLPQGVIALQALRAYQEWSTASQERGLVEVYQYLTRIAPALAPIHEGDLVHAFRTGKAVRARTIAAETYADALLALGSFLASYNRFKCV